MSVVGLDRVDPINFAAEGQELPGLQVRLRCEEYTPYEKQLSAAQ